MKLLRRHYDLVFYIYLPIFIIILAGVVFGKNHFVEFLKLHWLVWPALIILLFQKITHIKIGDIIRFKFITALSLTICVQLSTILSFFLICDTAIFSFPVLSLLKPEDFTKSFSILIFNWGLFPWGLIILLAIIMIYSGYVQKIAGRASLLITPLFKNQPGDSISIFVDAFCRLCFAYSYSFTLVFFIAQLGHIVSQQWQIPLLHGVAVGVVMMMSLLIYIDFKHIPRKFVLTLFNLKWPAGLIMLAYIGAFCALLFFVTAILVVALKLTPTLAISLPMFAFTEVKLSWQVFVALWWLGWSPIIATMLIKIWAGHRVIWLILSSIILPLILFISCLINPNWLTAFFQSLPMTMRWIFFSLTLGLFIILFCNKTVLRYIARASLPSFATEKTRSAQVSLIAIIPPAFGITLVYFVTGFYSLSFLASIIFFLLIYFVLYTIVAFCFRK